MAIRFDTTSRVGSISFAIAKIINRGDVSHLSLRAIGREARVSAATLLNQLDSRERLMRVCAAHFARNRTEQLRIRVGAGGLEQLLPQDDDDVFLERAWLGWQELAHTNGGVANFVAKALQEERHLVLGWLSLDRVPDTWEPSGCPLDEPSADALLAALAGLRQAVCRPPAIDRMPLERARQAWATALSAAALSSRTIASGSAAE